MRLLLLFIYIQPGGGLERGAEGGGNERRQAEEEGSEGAGSLLG
jgi:hypothetical protein